MSALPCITPLFVPADRPERYARAAASGADAIIIDLEDAVTPAAKDDARAALCKAGALPAANSIIVRINACHTPWHADDLAALAGLSLAGIMLPKAEAPADIASVVACLPGMPIIALIESARGLADLRAIAPAHGITRLAFGSIDFCADLGMQHMRETLLSARAEIVLASRIANLVAPIDGVTTAIDDASLIEDDARHAGNLGFGGKLCIHPRQITPARRGFRPSTTDIAWARLILGAADAGAVMVDGAMVDAPVRLRARQILERAGPFVIDRETS